ncbi:porphobilinogen deaminase-like [Ostrea edulis]|uniref:porphobilinogen deaminase-like n=1 Tax=Ostrea edulis TaxID=37623 RepID=UPI002094FDAE|nr:porphobilinogen deaminase-like [Ostrea edulis]
MDPKKIIRVGSRKSQLAMIQTTTIIEALTSAHPDVSFEVVSMETIGDKVQDVALPKIGLSGVFTKELETALFLNHVDIVVHSMKDCPALLPNGLVIGTVFKRDSPYDVVVMNIQNTGKTLSELPAGSVVGTSSLRRIAQVSRIHPHLKFESIRGSLNSRLEKLDDCNKYAALILAEAGLSRMGWENRLSERLEDSGCLYAVCQGAIGVECREDDKETLSLLDAITDRETMLQCVTERSFIKHLGVGYKAPVCVHCDITKDEIRLSGAVYSLDGQESQVLDKRADLHPDGQRGKGDVIPTQNANYMSVAVGSKAPREEMAVAQRTGAKLAEEFLNSAAKDVLMTAKVSTENAILLERTRRAIKV